MKYLQLTDDVTWDNVASSCWSISEISSGITCACLPTLRPLLNKFMPLMGSRNGYDGASIVDIDTGVVLLRRFYEEEKSKSTKGVYNKKVLYTHYSKRVYFNGSG